MKQILLAGFLLLAIGIPANANSPWGREYFPNTSLTTQDGETVRFFDDMIEGRIVVINFIYTQCKDTCPLETAQLVKVQEILGDRLGKDIFFYSISLDPENDTPEVMKKYKEQFRAEWTFLTGEEEEIFDLQKKLGLFLEEIRDGLSNHNVRMIIGNQATGRWMKRAPFENPYVLADQIGNWLDDWKRPQKLDGYLNAPKLRELPRGEQMFRTRCSSCHTVTGHEEVTALGPDLLGVTRQRKAEWLINWLRAPDQMIEDKDSIAIALYEKYNKLAMPNLRLNQEEAEDLLTYLEEETQRVLGEEDDASPMTTHAPLANTDTEAAVETGMFEKIVEIVNPRVRASHPASKVNQAYLTIVNPGTEELTITSLRSDSFESVAMIELAKTEGMMKRQPRSELTIPRGGQVEFKAGGLYLICTNRRKDLSPGEQVDIILTFSSGAEQIITASVTGLN